MIKEVTRELREEEEEEEEDDEEEEGRSFLTQIPRKEEKEEEEAEAQEEGYTVVFSQKAVDDRGKQNTQRRITMCDPN